MEKPQNYLSRLRRHPLLWNLALIAAIILAMAVAAHILMQLGTRHGARRTVPDLPSMRTGPFRKRGKRARRPWALATARARSALLWISSSR